VKLTREILIEAMDPRPSNNDLGYCIVVLHPGDKMHSPNSKPNREMVVPNQTTSDVAYRLAYGMGWWVGPTPAGEIRHDDAPTICSCGVRKHNPPTPEDVIKKREAEEAAARKTADRRAAAQEWAHARVQETFNSGLAMSRDDVIARYKPVFDGFTAQWLSDNPEKEGV
jgi:hypothetical protein